MMVRILLLFVASGVFAEHWRIFYDRNSQGVCFVCLSDWDVIWMEIGWKWKITWVLNRNRGEIMHAIVDAKVYIRQWKYWGKFAIRDTPIGCIKRCDFKFRNGIHTQPSKRYLPRTKSRRFLIVLLMNLFQHFKSSDWTPLR